jgi:molybdopterin/thiamine biosynthesis adenylyltransferase/rhodanese-related sulfurtransferase
VNHMSAELTPEEIQRYARHLVIPDVGIQGQRKLKNASILIVGTGGLGSPIALYLAASGVGRIGIVDYDVIELSNLQRQVIHSSDGIGSSKVQSAKRRMLAINPDIRVDAYEELFTSQNAEKIAEPYEILIDGTDNLPTRYLLNDLGVFTGKPYVYGAVYRFSGQLAVLDARKGACYRCVFPEPPPAEMVPPCGVAGIVGVVPGTIGLLQATEVIKLILGIGHPLISQFLLYDALDSSTRIIQMKKNPDCKVCSAHPEITHLIDYEQFCNMRVRGQELEIENEHQFSPIELQQKLKAGDPIRLIDLREPVELQISKIAGAENVPFHQLPVEMKKWDKSQPIVLICHIGFLSAIAVRLMAASGFTQVKNLNGGMRAWSKEVDSSLHSY